MAVAVDVDRVGAVDPGQVCRRRRDSAENRSCSAGRAVVPVQGSRVGTAGQVEVGSAVVVAVEHGDAATDGLLEIPGVEMVDARRRGLFDEAGRRLRRGQSAGADAEHERPDDHAGEHDAKADASQPLRRTDHTPVHAISGLRMDATRGWPPRTGAIGPPRYCGLDFASALYEPTRGFARGDYKPLATRLDAMGSPSEPPSGGQACQGLKIGGALQPNSSVAPWFRLEMPPWEGDSLAPDTWNRWSHMVPTRRRAKNGKA